MSKKYLLVFTFALSSCSASNQWEDLTAKYNPGTHLLSTERGHYEVYFPQQPVAIPGQCIKHYVSTDPVMPAIYSPGNFVPQPIGSRIYNYIGEEYCPDFQWAGDGLTLTARYNIPDTPCDLKDLPGPGGLYKADIKSDRLDVKKEISNRIGTTEKQLDLIESSRTPMRSTDYVEGMEVAGKKPPWKVFKLRVLFDRHSMCTYTLIAEGSQKALDGVEAQQFFNSFSYFERRKNPILLSPQYASSQSLERLNQIKDQWNPTQARLCAAILNTGLTSSEAIKQVQEAFKLPSDRLKKNNPSYGQEWQNYVGYLQDKLGYNYQVTGKDGMASRKIFGEHSKPELYIDITRLDVKGALAILLDDEGKLVDCYAHTPVSDLTNHLCEAISEHGLISDEAFKEICQTFGYPMPGVSLDNLTETLNNKLRPSYAAYSKDLSCFKACRDNNRNDTCFAIQQYSDGKGVQILLDSEGKFIQSEYY